MGPRTSRELGRRAEQLSFEYLQARGLRPVARNYHCRGGEIDLIMLDLECLVFVEVRYRGPTSRVAPSHSVDARKQRKLILTAAMFLGRHYRHSTRTTRFDVVAVTRSSDAGASLARVQWIKDAFRPNNSSL